MRPRGFLKAPPEVLEKLRKIDITIIVFALVYKECISVQIQGYQGELYLDLENSSKTN